MQNQEKPPTDAEHALANTMALNFAVIAIIQSPPKEVKSIAFGHLRASIALHDAQSSASPMRDSVLKAQADAARLLLQYFQ